MLNISFTQSEHKEKISDLLNLDEHLWRTKYKRLKDAMSWKYAWAKEDALNSKNLKLTKVNYRPFDSRWTLYTGKSGGLYARPTYEVSKQFIIDENIGLVIGRQGQVIGSGGWDIVSITNKVLDFNYYRRGGELIFPLYLYSQKNSQQTIEDPANRTPNLNQEIVKEIADKLTLTFTNEKETTENTFAPIDILDYIYAVLHSPTFRDKYKEFLKIDFPRVPYPKDKNTFWDLVELGKEVREIHLLESSKVEDYITSYEMKEDAENDHNVITTKIGNKDWEIIDQKKQLGRIWINDCKYFDNIPLTAWEFYIGGYQPAQKWLKDRKERELNFEDILHYQKIIVALTETDRIMKEIDKIEIG